MRGYRAERWRYQFNEHKQVPPQKETFKVLTRMLVPTKYSIFKLEALLCFWEALYPQGELEALFEVDVQSESFKKLKVFSMSNYLSQLLKTTEKLEVEMTDADARIDWLRKIYS